MRQPYAVFCGLFVIAVGCSRGELHAHRPMDPAQSRLLEIGRAYGRFNALHDRGPQSTADLKPILEQDGVGDDVFLSPRDQQPFVICWGLDLTAPRQPGVPWTAVAYEKLGNEGRRFVLTTLRHVTEVPDAEFSRIRFPPGHKPQGG